MTPLLELFSCWDIVSINKGIKLATGDIVGILNSDDEFYDNDVISNISKAFMQNNNLDAIIGDIVFINNKEQVHRKYTASNWNPKKFAWGMMPPHPTFYCKKIIFEKFGFYIAFHLKNMVLFCFSY